MTDQSELLRFVQTAWQQSLDRMSELGIPFDEMNTIKSVEFEEKGHPFNTRVEDGSLYVDREYTERRSLFFGLIARECFKSVFPSNEICEECIEDLATEFARQGLDEGISDEWLKLWYEHTPLAHVGNVHRRNPSTSYPALYELVKSAGLQSIVSDILTVSKYQMQLSVEDYLEYFETRYNRFSAELSKTELHIINYLLRDPTITTEFIADRLSLSSQWVSTRLNELQNRYILRKFETVRFSTIGVRMFHLLLGTDDPNESCSELLGNCPFVYGIRRVLSGPWQLLVTLTVPDNHESIKAIDQFVQKVNRLGFQTLISELVSSGVHYCFDYYSDETATWNIPWDLERVQVRKILDDFLSTAFPKIHQSRDRARRTFDGLDMKILDRVWHKVNSVAKIRKELRVGQERVATKLRQLREDGIISEQWEVHNIGLVESVAVFTSDIEIGKAIAAWANRLPKSIVSFDLDDKLSMISSVPVGGGYGMVWALENLPKAVSAILLGPPIYGRWGFPLEFWHSESQRWIFPEQQVVDWFEGLR